jgi:hypothetical protein
MTRDSRWISWLRGRNWRPLNPDERVGLWTDSYSNVMGVVDW